jgi:DNA-binding ferritin-like protein
MFSSGPQSAPEYTRAPNESANGAVATGQYVPEPQDKPKAPAKSKAGGDVGAFIQQLIALSSYVKELETQSHLIHLNIECPNFLAFHAFLKDQYETHLEQFDTLAEFVRSMDYLMPMCNTGLRDLMPPVHEVSSYEWKGMLGVYYKNLEELGMKAKKLEPIAAKIGAIDIQNYMADLTKQAFKAAWFIKASLRNS